MDKTDTEFIRVLRECMHSLQRFNEFQRQQAGVDLNGRERLLLKILGLREARNLPGIPVTKLAAEYNSMALDRMKASESTISAVLISLHHRDFVNRTDEGKSIAVVLGESGRRFLAQDEEMMNERLKIYMQVCPDSADREIIKKFLVSAMHEFERKIASWQRGLT